MNFEEDGFFDCPFFNVNRLARVMNKMAEEEFALIGLSPSYAYLLMVVEQNPGITQKDLSETLHIAPSTSTRFIDKLVSKGLVQRKSEGKLALIYPTDKGLQLHKEINRCWQRLNERFADIVGSEQGSMLSGMMHAVSEKVEKK